jgi:hypothetical protein
MDKKTKPHKTIISKPKLDITTGSAAGIEAFVKNLEKIKVPPIFIIPERTNPFAITSLLIFIKHIF